MPNAIDGADRPRTATVPARLPRGHVGRGQPRVRVRVARETLPVLPMMVFVMTSAISGMGLVALTRPLQGAGVPDAVLEAAHKLLFVVNALAIACLFALAIDTAYERWRAQ